MEGNGGEGRGCCNRRRVGVHLHWVVEVASCADGAGVEGTTVGKDGVADVVAA